MVGGVPQNDRAAGRFRQQDRRGHVCFRNAFFIDRIVLRRNQDALLRYQEVKGTDGGVLAAKRPQNFSAGLQPVFVALRQIGEKLLPKGRVTGGVDMSVVGPQKHLIDGFHGPGGLLAEGDGITFLDGSGGPVVRVERYRQRRRQSGQKNRREDLAPNASHS